MITYGVQRSMKDKSLLDVVKITVGPRGKVEYDYVARDVRLYKAVDYLQKKLYDVLRNIKHGYDTNRLGEGMSDDDLDSLHLDYLFDSGGPEPSGDAPSPREVRRGPRSKKPSEST